MSPSPARLPALLLLCASASAAQAATSLDIGEAQAPAGSSVQVDAVVHTTQPCLSGIIATVQAPPSLTLTGLVVASGSCIADFEALGGGAHRVGLACVNAIADGSTPLKLTFSVGPGATGSLAVTGTNGAVSSCEGELSSLSVTGGAVTAVATCVRGDIHPDGVGNGTVALADFVLGRRKLLGITSVVARDLACGDLHPGTVTCAPAVGKSSFCSAGNQLFQLGDVLVIRRIVAELYQSSCTTCSPATAAAGSRPDRRLPGDVAPADAADGFVNVADVVLSLRWAVGLGAPDAEQLLRADVAPARSESSLMVVQGNSSVDVADVVLLLRAAVGLSTLAWPERALTVHAEADASVVGWQARVAGLPAWAHVADGSGCLGGDAQGSGGGTDSSGDAWAATCATDPSPLHTPADLTTLRYRAPEPLHVEELTLRTQGVDFDLEAVTLDATLQAR